MNTSGNNSIWFCCKVCGAHYPSSYSQCPNCAQKGYREDMKKYEKQVEGYATITCRRK